jgi:hypothetical protein
MEVALSGVASVEGTSECRYQLNRANWEIFSTTLERELETSPQSDDVDIAAALLTKAISTSADRSIPKARPRHRNVPWWSPEIKRLSTDPRLVRICKGLEELIDFGWRTSSKQR